MPANGETHVIRVNEYRIVQVQSRTGLWHVFELGHREWGAFAIGHTADGFTSRAEAMDWVSARMAEALDAHRRPA